MPSTGYLALHVRSIVVISMLLEFLIANCEAGSCFTILTESGNCKRFYSNNIDREDCCRLQGFYVAGNLTRLQIFRASIEGGVRNCFPACSSTSTRDACDSVICPRDRVCQISSRTGLPACICQVRCPLEDETSGHICASDGNIYESLCALRQAQCEGISQIERIDCMPAANATTCTPDLCPAGKYCALNELAQPECYHQSIFSCFQQGWMSGGQRAGGLSLSRTVEFAVCSTNNVTYKSSCQLDSVSARKGRRVQIAYEATCHASADCSVCPSDTECFLHHVTGMPVCRFPCSQGYGRGPEGDCEDPRRICASDGTTFANKCQFVSHLCQRKVFLEVDHIGTCRGAKK